MNRPYCQNGGLTILGMRGHEDLARRLASRVVELGENSRRNSTPVDVVIPKLGYFESCEPMVRHTSDHIAGHDVMIITSGPGTPEMLTDTLNILGTVARRRPTRIILFTPYFPLGRSDVERTDELHMPAILVEAWKAVGKVGDTPLLNRVVCVDPHSESIFATGGGGFVTPIRMTKKLLLQILQYALEITDKVVISFPDSSSKKRFKDAIPEVEALLGRTFPIIFASANRDAKKKVIENVYGDVESIEGSLVIEIDDETQSLGTLDDVAHMLRRRGAATVWAAVTHCALCGKGPQRLMAEECGIECLFVMDTIDPYSRPDLQLPLESGRLRVISWFEEYAEVIYRAHWNLDIRALR